MASTCDRLATASASARALPEGRGELLEEALPDSPPSREKMATEDTEDTEEAPDGKRLFGDLRVEP
jgi:hypothetical protein